jgi:hypothetical protein
MTGIDLKALRTPVIALLIVCLAAGGGVYYTDLLSKQANQRLQQQEKQLVDARTRLQKSGDEKDVIVRYLSGYQQLARVGFIGEEQRINWLDGLRLANQQADIFGVDYDISAQRPYLHAAEYNASPLSLKQSIMRLRFRLLHEEDLMRFFNALARLGAGVFAIDQCVLQRLDTGGLIRFQPNIMADCEVSWITATPGTEKKP